MDATSLFGGTLRLVEQRKEQADAVLRALWEELREERNAVHALPCFCGNSAYLTPLHQGPGEQWTQVVCSLNCGWRGPEHANPEKAVLRWNEVIRAVFSADNAIRCAKELYGKDDARKETL